MSWVNKLDILNTIKCVVKSQKHFSDLCLDPLRYEDLTIGLVREALVQELSNPKPPKELLNIDVPKENLNLRPASTPQIQDLIIYEAVTRFVISTIIDQLPNNSYSLLRVKNEINKVGGRKIDVWIAFEKETEQCILSGNFKFAVVTDISRYFENISLDLLADRLKILSNNEDYTSAVNFLFESFLKYWTSATNSKLNFGLPQGPDASGMLADVYLYQVDREMIKNGIKYFRYMDDIRIFARNRTEMVRAIIILNRSLRELKLGLNDKKHSIYNLDERETLAELIDPEGDRLGKIDAAIRSRKRGEILAIYPNLLLLGEEIHSKSKYRKRYFRFFVGRVIDLMKFNLVPKIYINELVEKMFAYFIDYPHLSNYICWFLLSSSQYEKALKEPIQTFMINFICDSDRNVFEWQEMWALDTIRQLGRITKDKIMDLEKHCAIDNDFCYSQLMLIKGGSGDNDDREQILRDGKFERNLYRATRLAIQELNKDVIVRAGLPIPQYFKKYAESAVNTPKYGAIYSLHYQDLLEENTDFLEQEEDYEGYYHEESNY